MKQKIFFFAHTGLTLVAGILLCLAFLTECDSLNTYFSVDAILPTIALILATLGIAFGVVWQYENKKTSISVNGPAFFPFAVTLGIGSIAMFLHTADNLWYLFGGIGLLLSCIGYCGFLLPMGQKNPYPFSICLMFGQAGYIIVVAVTYLDMSVNVNADFKILLHLAMLTAILFQLSIIRKMLDKSKPFWLSLIFLFTLSLMLTVGIGTLPVFFTENNIAFIYGVGVLQALGCGISCVWVEGKNTFTKEKA